MKIGCLIRLFESMDRQVAYIHTQLEWIDIQLSDCSFSACNPFQLSNQTLAHHVVERIRSDVPKQPCPSKNSGNDQDQANLAELAPA